MARLPRVKQKIFAGTAATNQITKFGTIKDGAPAYASTAADIMNSNFEEGWSAAVEDDYAPYRQDRNAVDTAITQQLAYIFQEGTPEWDSTTTYYNGSVVKKIDGTTVKLYRSIADNNTSVLTDTTKWRLFLNIDNTGVLQGVSINNGTFNNPSLTGTVTVPNQAVSDNSQKAANTSFVKSCLSGAVSTISTTNLSGNKAVVSNSNGKIVASSVTSTELGYLSGVTSSVQNQINAKAGLASNNNFTGTNTFAISPVITNGGVSAIIRRGTQVYTELQTQKADGTRTGGFRNNTDNGNTTVIYAADSTGTTIKSVVAAVWDGTNAYATAPTPADGDISEKIATTRWINNNVKPRIADRVDVSATTYTAPKNGMFYLTPTAGSHITAIYIDDVLIMYHNGHSGSSHGQPNAPMSVMLGAGQIMKVSNSITSADSARTYAKGLFVPFGY